jgi:glycine/D-amino acid oxidase-like deaminating enzyme
MSDAPRGKAADVIVLGAGIVGAATAYFLAQRGISVLLIEGEAPAWGASGRNPGFQWLHTRKAGIQMELGLAGRRLADRLREELEDFEMRPSGGMIYFNDERQLPLFKAFVAERRAAGLPMELIDGQQAREHCPILSPKVLGASWNPLDAHQNTGKLVDALVAAALRHGARLRAGCPIEKLAVEAGRCVGVITAAGETIPAGKVILAAGAWSPKLLAPLGLGLPISAMRLQVVETEPAPFRFEPLLYGPTAVKQYAHIRALPDYSEDGAWHPMERQFPGIEFLELAAQRKDGRIRLGCPMDFPGLDDRPTVAGIALTLAVLTESLPAIRDLAVERVYAGLLPETPDALPVLDPDPGIEGLVLNAGHVFGNLAGPLSGKMIAQHLAGEKTDFDLAQFRLDRPALRVNRESHGRW